MFVRLLIWPSKGVVYKQLRGEFQNGCFEVAVATITNLNVECYTPLDRAKYEASFIFYNVMHTF